MKTPAPDLTIVIPAYREARRIGPTLDELATFLKRDKTLKQLAVEVLVVAADGGDDTPSVVRAKQAKFNNLRLLRPGPRVGKGRDVRYGMLRARGRAVLFMDADLATPLKYLPLFYERFEQGDDLVIAVRNLYLHHPNFIRRLLSNTGNALFRVAAGMWIEDTQCGFKLFSRPAGQLCFSRLRIMGWGFDMEILAIARANRLKISRFRVNDWSDMLGGSFNEGLLKNSVISLGELAYIFANRLKRTYKA